MVTSMIWRKINANVLGIYIDLTFFGLECVIEERGEGSRIPGPPG
jgi:hypothetical protein